MVHQHFRLLPSLTVAENLYLNRQPRRFGLFADHAAMRRGAARSSRVTVSTSRRTRSSAISQSGSASASKS